MQSLFDALKGKKTYIIAVAIFVLGGLKATGYIDEDAYQSLVGLFGAAGLATLRHGIDK